MRGATQSCWSRPSSIRRATPTCYGASSFLRLGQTAGYGRRSGVYVEHGQIKDVYVRALHRYSVRVLAGTFDHPLLSPDPRISGTDRLQHRGPLELDRAHRDDHRSQRPEGRRTTSPRRWLTRVRDPGGQQEPRRAE